MDNKEKSPEKELIESIGLMIEKGMESNTNIYTGVVKSVDGKRAVVTVNGQNQNVAIATADVSSGNVVRVFVPEGNMSAAFIIKAEASGGGGTTTTAYGDLTGKPRVNGVTLVDNKTSKELNLYGTGNAPPYPVTSVNGQTGDVTISAGGNVDSVNGKTGAVVLTQDDIDNGTTYVRTHNDFTDALKTQINTNEDNIAMLDGDVEGLQTDVGTLKTNVTSLQTALTSKQDVVVGAASTITENNLTTNRALVSNSSGKVAVSNVTSTELGYLYGVTGNVQTQLNNKLEEIPVANSTTLGGVKPVTKTSDMTQNVGVDANGALYTVPGGGGTGSGDMLKSVYDPNNKSTDIFAYADNAANARQAKILVNGILEGDGAGNISAADVVQAELLDVDIAPPFYVNCTISALDSYDTDVTHDKTVSEIKTAYESGRSCYAIVEISGLTVKKFVLGLVEIGQTVVGDYATFATYEMYNGAFPSWHNAGFISIEANGTASGYLGNFQNDMLPIVGDDDEGKFLKVSYGQWVAEQVTTEAWTFILEDGSTITKNVCIG